MTIAPLDLFAPGSATVLALVGARVSGLVLVAPVFSSRTVPMAVRSAVVVLFTLLVQPAAFAARVGQPALTPAMFAGEAVIGVAMGLGAAFIVGAAETAGELLAIQIGLSGEALLDPLAQTQSTALGQFATLFTIALLLSLDLHLVMVDALVSSVQRIPVGAAVHVDRGLAAVVGLGGRLFGLGVRFAAPVIGAVMIANVALAVLGRVVPQMNLLAVAFPVQIAVGLFALAAALPFIATSLRGWRGEYDTMLGHALGALVGAGGR